MTSARPPLPDHGLMWFRRDLRLSDNPAWSAVTTRHEHVTALFVVDDRLVRSSGPLRLRQLAGELAALDAALRGVGGRLRVERGDPVRVVGRVAAEVGAAGVAWNTDVTPFATARDAAVTAALDVEPSTFAGHLVLPPGSVVTKEGTVHKVFTAFHRAWLATRWRDWPAPGGAVIAADAGAGIDCLAVDGNPPLAPGEDAADELLRAFVDGPVNDYRTARDEIPVRGTSELSVALRFGTISPRHVVRVVGHSGAARSAFVRQLAWRDWYAHLLAEHPQMPRRALRPEYDRVEWRDDSSGLAAWAEGRTGYPIVDAGMRQLAQTGRMHNRVRMITASFLVKDLLIDWRRGEAHFRRLLLDGDPAQNVGNWQWVAGTGPDAAPYFRVFNPTLQSRTHDPRGEYLRRWVPELAGLDDRGIHAPWELGPLELAAAGVVLGETYPAPIVDHAAARLRAIAAYQRAVAS